MTAAWLTELAATTVVLRFLCLCFLVVVDAAALDGTGAASPKVARSVSDSTIPRVRNRFIPKFLGQKLAIPSNSHFPGVTLGSQFNHERFRSKS